MGFPGGSVLKNLPMSQCRRHGFNRWSVSEDPTATDQLSPCTTILDLTLQSQEMRPQSPCSMLQSRKTPQPPSPHSRAGRCDSRVHAPEPGDATPKPKLQSQETRPPSPRSRAGRHHNPREVCTVEKLLMSCYQVCVDWIRTSNFCKEANLPGRELPASESKFL